MHTNVAIALNIIVIIYLNSYPICGEEPQEKEGSTAKEDEQFLEEVLPDLYRNYREALERANETTFRRLLKNNRLLQMHIEKLREVNGVKKHNLIIKLSTQDNPIIYINNPVETKLPNPYLSMQEFKDLLTDRILKEKKEFAKTYLKPKIVEKKYTPRMAKYKNVIKVHPNRKLSTVHRTEKIKSTKNKRIITKINNQTVTIIPSVILNNAASNIEKTKSTLKMKANVHRTTPVTSTTQAPVKQTIDKVKNTITLQYTSINNSRESVTYRTTDTKMSKISSTDFEVERQHKPKLNETKPLVMEKVKKSKDNVTESSMNIVPTRVIEVNRSHSEENNKYITELVEEKRQVDTIVEQLQSSTPESETNNISKTTITQYNELLNIDSEGYEHNTVSEVNNKNITDLVKENIQEDKIMEQTSSPDNVTNYISETTITQYKGLSDSDGNKRNTTIPDPTNSLKDRNEENTEASTINDISEDVTQETEEDSSDSEGVSEDITSTTALTTRTRLSRPLVFMANEKEPVPYDRPMYD